MTADALNTDAHSAPASTDEDRERSAIAALSVEEKVLLLTGADSWRTQGAEALGLRPMITSDGPAGVRGVIKDERSPSSSLPCPSAMGATWDPGLIGELAAALGAEARGKGVDILLGPTINLMRTPLGGRGFECFAEDPVLTAVVATAYVRGLQSAGVAATVKHYVANDSETERWSYDARISEQVLRELYLVPFEACVREAATMLVMAAYNTVNGVRMTEHDYLLKEVLKGEWGFDGVVTSDWHAARSTAATALAALDLSMPGPDGPWGSGPSRGAGRQDRPAAPAGPAGRRGAHRGPAGPARPRGAGRPDRPGSGTAGHHAIFRATEKRAGSAASRACRDPQPGAHRAERVPADHPGRRQRGRGPGQRLTPGRGAGPGAGRPAGDHRRARLRDMGDGARAAGRLAP